MLAVLGRDTGDSPGKRIREKFKASNLPNIAFHATMGDSILAYAAEIASLQDGRVMDNLYELDYRQHAVKLEQQALPLRKSA